MSRRPARQGSTPEDWKPGPADSSRLALPSALPVRRLGQSQEAGSGV